MFRLAENHLISQVAQRDIYFRFSKGRTGTSHVNCRYLLRAEALDDEKLNNIYLQNYPDYIRGVNYELLTQDVITFNQLVEKQERRFITLRASCTHYRIIMSFKGKFETKYARGLAIEYLQRQFPYSVVLAVVHQNTNNTHIHVHLQAREITGKKFHISIAGYRKLDMSWGAIFAREFGREILDRHLGKKEEMRQYKIACAIARKSGLDRTPNRPNRATYNQADYLNYERRITDVPRETVPSSIKGEPSTRVSRSDEPTFERSITDNGTRATTSDRISRGAELRARVGEFVRTFQSADQQVSRAEPNIARTERQISGAEQQTERTIQRTRELGSERSGESKQSEKLTREIEFVGHRVQEQSGTATKLERGFERLGQDVINQAQQFENVQQRIGRQGEQLNQSQWIVEGGNRQIEHSQQRVGREGGQLNNSQQVIERANQRLNQSQQNVGRQGEQLNQSQQRVGQQSEQFKYNQQNIGREGEQLFHSQQRVGREGEQVKYNQQNVERESGQIKRNEQGVVREGEQVREIEQNLARGKQQIKQLERNSDRLTTRVREFSQQRELVNQQNRSGRDIEIDYPSR